MNEETGSEAVVWLGMPRLSLCMRLAACASSWTLKSRLVGKGLDFISTGQRKSRCNTHGSGLLSERKAACPNVLHPLSLRGAAKCSRRAGCCRSCGAAEPVCQVLEVAFSVWTPSKPASCFLVLTCGFQTLKSDACYENARVLNLNHILIIWPPVQYPNNLKIENLRSSVKLFVTDVKSLVYSTHLHAGGQILNITLTKITRNIFISKN